MIRNIIYVINITLKTPTKSSNTAPKEAFDHEVEIWEPIIEQLTSLNPWLASKSQLQERLVQVLAVAVPAADTWRPALLHKLLGDRLEAHYNAKEEEATELSRLISSLVAN